MYRLCKYRYIIHLIKVKGAKICEYKVHFCFSFTNDTSLQWTLFVCMLLNVPTKNYFIHMETSLYPGEGLQILAYAWHLRSLSSEGSLTCDIYYDTGPRVLLSRPKDRKSKPSPPRLEPSTFRLRIEHSDAEPWMTEFNHIKTLYSRYPLRLKKKSALPSDSTTIFPVKRSPSYDTFNIPVSAGK